MYMDQLDLDQHTDPPDMQHRVYVDYNHHQLGQQGNWYKLYRLTKKEALRFALRYKVKTKRYILAD
jgi:hypothetical protein